jgi:SAM-dependent methyltransferase
MSVSPTPKNAPAHAFAAPSDWVARWTRLLAPGSYVLDVACGHGRHVHWLASAGHRVTAIDKEADLLAPLAEFAEATLLADLEAGPWPLPGRQFDAVLVTNYLWRPLLPALKAAVAPGGLLIYETFAKAHAALGRPRRPEFLLEPGELIDWLRPPATPGECGADAMAHWHVIAFEEGRLPARGDVPEREVQRIVARRGVSGAASQNLLATPG